MVVPLSADASLGYVEAAARGRTISPSRSEHLRRRVTIAKVTLRNAVTPPAQVPSRLNIVRATVAMPAAASTLMPRPSAASRTPPASRPPSPDRSRERGLKARRGQLPLAGMSEGQSVNSTSSHSHAAPSGTATRRKMV